MSSPSYIVKALLTRLIFASHILVSVWWVVRVTLRKDMWYLGFFDALLFLETLFSLFFRRGQEYKWFSPSIFCHLAGIIPCAWILELHLHDVRKNGNSTNKLNADVVIVSAERWTDLIEQTTMLMMILGRWLLPTAQGMTKDSLSQLLLVNLAMCADIIEFFDILKLDFVKNSQTLIITILVLWTWSLMQFPFNTMSKIDEDDGTNDGKPKKGDKPSRGRRSIVPVGDDGSAAQIPSFKDRASMTSWDFKHAIAAKRISRDMLLMSHNYSRGLPPNYLPDFGRNSYQPRLGRTNGALGEDDLTSSSQTNATYSNKSNLSGFSRGPGRYSLDVGQMRPKRLKGHMTTSMTSPNLMLEASQRQRQLLFLNDNNANVPKSSLPVPETRIDIEETEEEKPTKSRITTELVAILMSLFMQDGPFLTFRLFIIARYQAYEYMVIFLTVKNALVLALQVYRLCVLHCTCYDHQENDFSPENQIDANSRLKNVQVAVTHKNEDQMEDKSFHESIPWTGKWRNSLRGCLHEKTRTGASFIPT